MKPKGSKSMTVYALLFIAAVVVVVAVIIHEQESQALESDISEKKSQLSKILEDLGDIKERLSNYGNDITDLKINSRKVDERFQRLESVQANIIERMDSRPKHEVVNVKILNDSIRVIPIREPVKTEKKKSLGKGIGSVIEEQKK